MPEFGEVIILTIKIFLFGIILSIPALLLLLTGNLILLLIAYVWVALSGIFASVYVLTGWIEHREEEKQIDKWRSKKQESKPEKSFEERYREEVEKRKREEAS